MNQINICGKILQMIDKLSQLHSGHWWGKQLIKPEHSGSLILNYGNYASIVH